MNLYFHQGKYEIPACSSKEQSIITKVEGADGPSMAAAYTCMAMVEDKYEQNKQAESHYKQAIAIYQKNGPDCAEIASTLA